MSPSPAPEQLSNPRDRSYGLLAQSVGGGGGDGGFSVAGGISTGPGRLGLGGSGGVAGRGNAMWTVTSSAITTHGQDSHGLFVQSVGGGGGSGGFSVAGGLASGAVKYPASAARAAAGQGRRCRAEDDGNNQHLGRPGLRHPGAKRRRRGRRWRVRRRRWAQHGGGVNLGLGGSGGSGGSVGL